MTILILISLDTTVDVMTAKNLGISTVLVQTGASGMDGKYNVKADYETPDLLNAVKLILAKKN
jgi:ribonucleotide monophosphatase NagD (HAD superfamily)